MLLIVLYHHSDNRIYQSGKPDLLSQTLYELWKYRKPNINYCKVFGCKCYILNTKDNLGKFDPKFDVGISLGYSNTSKTYGVYIKRTLIVEEFIHVIFDESNSSSMEKVVVDDNVDEKLQEDYQMIAKRMHYLKIKRSNMKK